MKDLSLMRSLDQCLGLILVLMFAVLFSLLVMTTHCSWSSLTTFELKFHYHRLVYKLNLKNCNWLLSHYCRLYQYYILPPAQIPASVLKSLFLRSRAQFAVTLKKIKRVMIEIVAVMAEELQPFSKVYILCINAHSVISDNCYFWFLFNQHFFVHKIQFRRARSFSGRIHSMLHNKPCHNSTCQSKMFTVLIALQQLWQQANRTKEWMPYSSRRPVLEHRVHVPASVV